jgi:hypothetical protein
VRGGEGRGGEGRAGEGGNGGRVGGAWAASGRGGILRAGIEHELIL